MDSALVHYELFVRPDRRGSWTLALATENRAAAMAAADTQAKNPEMGVRLCKETRDPETGDFRVVTIMERGPKAAPPPARAHSRRPIPANQPTTATSSCNQPRDLYTTTARETIGRVLAGWLKRNGVTPFELLHRADLAERLEACDTELSAALAKLALDQTDADAMAPRVAALKALTRKTVDYIIKGDPDEAFQFGVTVASALGARESLNDKIEVLLDMLDSAPESGPEAVTALRVLQQPLVDLLASQVSLDIAAGEGLVLGDQLLVLLQIAAAPQVAALLTDAPNLRRLLPRPHGMAARLALSLHRRPALSHTRAVIARRAVAALASPDPLWPGDPVRTVEGVKILALLLAVCGGLIDQNEASVALSARWRGLASDDFVDARLKLCLSPVEDVEAVLDMIEAAVGRVAHESLGRKLMKTLAKPAFQREVRGGADLVAIRLRRLAALIGRVRAASMLSADIREGAERYLRVLAQALEADANRLAAQAPDIRRLAVG